MLSPIIPLCRPVHEIAAVQLEEGFLVRSDPLQILGVEEAAPERVDIVKPKKALSCRHISRAASRTIRLTHRRLALWLLDRMRCGR